MKGADYDSRFSERNMKNILRDFIHDEHLEDYYYIMDNTQNKQNLNISTNAKYQNAFLTYYFINKNRVMMNRKRVIEYFSVFQTFKNKIKRHKLKNSDYFAVALRDISKRLCVDPNEDTVIFLCSAMIHTFNPNLPIWDTHLLDYFGFIKSYSEINDYIKIYSEYKTKCESEIAGHGKHGNWFETWNNQLYEKYKYSHSYIINFTNIKKLDLYFWKEKYLIKLKINRNFERYKKYNACLFSENDKNDNDIDYIMQRALVGKVLKLLCDGIIRYMEHKMGQKQLLSCIYELDRNKPNTIYDCDVAIALKIMNNKEYINPIDNNMKTKIKDLIIYRNFWAHFNPALHEHIYKILDNSIELLWFVNAKEEVKEIERMKKYLGQHDLIPR